MFYERKIKYLDYMVNGVRNGNAGFWKLEARDTVCNMTLQVKGLRNSDSLRCPVNLVGNGLEKEIGVLELVQGRGNICLRGENLSNLGGIGIPYERLEGLRIPISTGREIRGVLREGNDALWGETSVPEEEIHEKEAADEIEFPGNELDVEGKMGVELEETEIEEAAVIENEHVEKEYTMELGTRECSRLRNAHELGAESESRRDLEAGTQSKSWMEPEKESIQKNLRESMSDCPGESVQENDFTKKRMEKPRSVLADSGLHRMRLCNSKWEQLWEIYPRMTPFRDEREYLSISPSDFVVLPAKYFRLANNSFLLHGYYNYKHLVLKRVESRKEEKYYIGVPGTFFEREKQVAVMFGFESFECMEEPAQTGDYGYYMMRIEL